MIYTFTPNPAVDYYINIKNFELNKINRVDECSFIGAGKGINCSILLDIMGIDNIASFFTAGFTGKYLADTLSERKHIDSVAFETYGNTRVNIKFVGEQDTAINAAGPIISETAKEELYKFVEKCNENDYFIISGSLPKNFDKSELLHLCKKINEKGSKLIIDVPDINKEDLKQINVYLIKPNLEEFASLLNKDINMNNYRDYLDDVLDLGVSNILLSLGKHGSYYAGEYGRYIISVPSVHAYSPVGAGDSTLAGFIGSIYQGKNIEQALKFANAAGVAKVKYEHLDSLSKIEEIVKDVVVVKE